MSEIVHEINKMLFKSTFQSVSESMDCEIGKRLKQHVAHIIPIPTLSV